jgi:Zn-dependent peptidase ImmA (M78 family)
MKNNKLHTSKEFLKKRFIQDKRSPEDIANECGVSVQLIYRQLKKFGLRK